MAYVIGVAGQAQHGKDTLADRLAELLNKERVCFDEPKWQEIQKSRFDVDYGKTPVVWARSALASSVKRVFMDTFGVNPAFIEEWKVKSEVPPGFDLPCRQALQFIGDGFRKIRGSIWLDLCFRENYPKIVSDVRYVNEFTRIYEEGGLNILVGRTDKLNDDPNGSEAQIRPYVDWALKNLKTQKVNQLKIARALGSELAGAPPGMEMFDIFVANDGSKDDFYDEIERVVLPFVKKFKFTHGEDS